MSDLPITAKESDFSEDLVPAMKKGNFPKGPVRPFSYSTVTIAIMN